MFRHSCSIAIIQGCPEEGPFDAIHVGAAAPTLPQALVDQLAKPGKMFIPVGNYLQHILEVEKDENGKVTEKKLMDVRVSYFAIRVQ